MWWRGDSKEIQKKTKSAVAKTRSRFDLLSTIFTKQDFDDSIWDDLEEVLISADVGLPTTEYILEKVRQNVREKRVESSTAVRELLRNELIEILDVPLGRVPTWGFPEEELPHPFAILVVGVNGAGKTTSIAKLAFAFEERGISCILAAADTFRAAAVEQIKIWGERLGVRVISHQNGSDPSSVAFDAIAAAKATDIDAVIVDTAGRLHNQSNLMDELEKIKRVIHRNLPNAPHETLLILDATTGQNGLQQAKIFSDYVDLTGIILAKLDGTSRGGIAFAIVSELKIPIYLLGTGESLEDLSPFNPEVFVDAILN